jgi:uncharacterized Zn finger protein
MGFGKIQEIIKEKNLEPSDCGYHTQRKLENNGKVRVLVINGIAHVEYICPKCKHYEYTTKEWKRPFSVKCSNCGYLIRIQKMKYLVKKELKEAKGK